MTQIKICGLTQAKDVQAAIEFGADLLGFVHVKKSPRFVNIPTLHNLLNLVPDSISTVIVVQNLAENQLEELRESLVFTSFQFHGTESIETVEKWGGYKVFHICHQQPSSRLQSYGTPFLLDTQVGSQKGGTGQPFDWSILNTISGPYIVAGGLNPDNISQLICKHRPWGVDVSSGIEIAPGIKNHQKMQHFITNARRASRHEL